MLGPARTPAVLHSLAGGVAGSKGARLFVVADSPQTISRALPRADSAPTGRRTNPHFLEQTLTRRPSKYTPEAFQLTLARGPASPEPLITPAPIGAAARRSSDTQHLGAAALLDQRHVRLERVEGRGIGEVDDASAARPTCTRPS